MARMHKLNLESNYLTNLLHTLHYVITRSNRKLQRLAETNCGAVTDFTQDASFWVSRHRQKVHGSVGQGRPGPRPDPLPLHSKLRRASGLEKSDRKEWKRNILPPRDEPVEKRGPPKTADLHARVRCDPQQIPALFLDVLCRRPQLRRKAGTPFETAVGSRLSQKANSPQADSDEVEDNSGRLLALHISR